MMKDGKIEKVTLCYNLISSVGKFSKGAEVRILKHIKIWRFICLYSFY